MIKLYLPCVIPYRSVRKGATNRFYNPLTEEKKKMQWLVRSQYSGRCLGGPIRQAICFEIAMPASWSQKKRQQMHRTPCTSTPDLDNVEKFLNDVLKKIVIEDDRLIWDKHVKKYWENQDRTIIYLWESGTE